MWKLTGATRSWGQSFESTGKGSKHPVIELAVDFSVGAELDSTTETEASDRRLGLDWVYRHNAIHPVAGVFKLTSRVTLLSRYQWRVDATRAVPAPAVYGRYRLPSPAMWKPTYVGWHLHTGIRIRIRPGDTARGSLSIVQLEECLDYCVLMKILPNLFNIIHIPKT